MRPYRFSEERFLSGLDAVERRRKKVCASKKLPFSWLRVDPCIEMPAIDEKSPAITHSAAVSRFIHDAIPFAGRGKESVMILCLDTRNRVMGVSQVHVGGRSTSAVDPVSVFQPAILLGASGVILVHNHPSGQASPSPEDLELTRRMGEASKLLSLGFLDHIILTDDPEVYYSFADQREMR